MDAFTVLFDPLLFYLSLSLIIAYAVLSGLSVAVFVKRRKRMLIALAASFLILMVIGLGSFYFEPPTLNWSYYYLVENFDWLKLGLDYTNFAQQELWLIFQSFNFLAIITFGVAMILAGRSRSELGKAEKK
ncbi:MAG: hypothetical protein WED07_09485 [Candidatus Freyarchaeum deiterrae]